jgi:hypothetical protein
MKMISLMDFLEIAIDSGCNQYKLCEGCKNIRACMDLWAGIHGKFFTRSMTKAQLKDYVDRFNQFLEERSKYCHGAGPD